MTAVFRDLDMEVGNLGITMRDKVLPHIVEVDKKLRDRTSAQSALFNHMDEIRSRIELEEKGRISSEQRLGKSFENTLVQLQTAIKDEATKGEANFSQLQSALRTLRADMENTGFTKQLDSVRRQVTQSREDVGKEVAERISQHQDLADDIQELRKAVTCIRKEYASTEETVQKFTLEEERARTTQISVVQENCGAFKHDVELELKSIRQLIDERVRQRRQSDDEITRNINECISLGQATREMMEASVSKGLDDLKQKHKNEMAVVNDALMRIDAQMNSQISSLCAQFSNWIDEGKLAWEASEKRIESTTNDFVRRSHESDSAAKVSLQQVRLCAEKEAGDRMRSEEIFRRQLEHLTNMVQSSSEMVHHPVASTSTRLNRSALIAEVRERTI